MDAVCMGFFGAFRTTHLVENMLPCLLMIRDDIFFNSMIMTEGKLVRLMRTREKEGGIQVCPKTFNDDILTKRFTQFGLALAANHGSPCPLPPSEYIQAYHDVEMSFIKTGEEYLFEETIIIRY